MGAVEGIQTTDPFRPGDQEITKAMELIASSRIVKAQQRLNASMPY